MKNNNDSLNTQIPNVHLAFTVGGVLINNKIVVNCPFCGLIHTHGIAGNKIGDTVKRVTHCALKTRFQHSDYILRKRGSYDIHIWENTKENREVFEISKTLYGKPHRHNDIFFGNHIKVNNRGGL